MKKKYLAILMAMMLCATGILNFGFEVKAEESTGNENYFAFQTVDALVGQADVGLCGVYLAGGRSIINKISSTKVGAGGITDAAIRCKVSINAVLEQLDNGSWVRWESWTTTVASGFMAAVDKSDTVETGHYYRVRCTHSAGTDRSSSYTSNLWM